MLKALPILALIMGFAGCATTPPANPMTHAAASGLPLGCVPNAESQKCDQFGAYYSGDDLRRTGAQHVGQALTLVDPQIGH